MSWVRKSDDWPTDPRWDGKSAAAIALHDLALAHANRATTNGHIGLGAIPMLIHGRPGFDDLASVIDELLEPHPVMGALWEHAAGGYSIVDYLLEQPSRDEVVLRRQKERDKKRRQRAAQLAREGLSPDLSPGDKVGDSRSRDPYPSRPVPNEVSKKPGTPEPARGEEPDYYALRRTGARQRAQTPDAGPQSLADIASQVLRHAQRHEASA